MRSLMLAVVSLFLLSCDGGEDETGAEAGVELDPAGAYGDCSGPCDGGSWLWDIDEGTGCICTPACAIDSDCPAVEGLAPVCQLQDDPDPGRCVLECEDASDCPEGLSCNSVAGCLWPQD